MMLEINNFKAKSHEPARFLRMRVPGSKSITNRAVLLASLAKGRSHLKDVLHSEDTAHMITICRQLGALITEEEDGSLIVEGCDGRFKPCDEELYVGNAGTCARFLCAALLRGEGSYVLRGKPRMHQRPMEALIEALRAWGAKIHCLEREGYLPLRVEAVPCLSDLNIVLRGDQSSQFLSALLMVAPFSRGSVAIEILDQELVSSSYVAMTLAMMNHFGIETSPPAPYVYSIEGRQSYIARDYSVPADASSASYFFAHAVITGQSIEIEGLEEYPVQSDLHFMHLLREMGAHAEFCDKSTVRVSPSEECLQSIDVDMSDMSDIVPSLAVLAMFAKGTTEIRGILHIRSKECDRIRALACELQKLGAKVKAFPDALSITAPKSITHQEVLLKTYDDHRIAMAFAVLAKRFTGIKLDNPDCVAKTYPGFFKDLEAIS
jgi:3-phosphoshikimate 1-carboxyvinyltransferase